MVNISMILKGTYIKFYFLFTYDETIQYVRYIWWLQILVLFDFQLTATWMQVDHLMHCHIWSKLKIQMILLSGKDKINYPIFIILTLSKLTFS